jgi:hypothetical protein
MVWTSDEERGMAWTRKITKKMMNMNVKGWGGIV